MFSFFYFCLVYSVVFCFVLVKSQKPCDGVIGQQFRPDPNDCRVYYLCGTGKDWKLQCGPNLVWNQKLGTCVPLGSGNDTCSQNIQSLPPLTPGPPTASLNLRSPSERRYSPFGESTWRPNCPPGSKQRFAHPTKCAQYYDCGADPRENWWGKNLRECSYPTVFDEVTGNCGYYTEVNCGRRELPLDPCDYLDHACRNSHCVPCFIKYASCTGKRNGVNVWKGREKTPFFVFCKDQRVVFHGQCVPSEPGKRHIFDPQYNTCRRPHARSPPNIHVTHNEAIHATPEGPIGPQLSPGPGPHRMTPFGHVDIPPNMHTNMSVGHVKVVITTPAPQQKQPPQPNPNQSPPQGFGQTNNNVPTAQGQQQNQPMQQKPQNQGQQTPSFSMPQNNQGQPQVSRQNNQNQGFTQSQTGQNTGFQFNNNKQPQVQNNNFQSNMNQNINQNNNNNNNNNNGMWQPKTTRQPQPFTNWPGSFGQPSKPNNPKQSSFSGNGAEAAWLQFNAGKPTSGNSQSVNMQQKQTSTFMIDNNSPGMMTKNTEQHMTIMQPNSQGPAQQNSQAGQQQPFQQQNAQAVNQQQQNQVQSGGYQKSFQQQQQTQANNNQGGNKAPNQNFQPQQQQNNIGSNQYQQQPTNQGGFQQKNNGGYQKQQQPQQNTQGGLQQQGGFQQPQKYRQSIRQASPGGPQPQHQYQQQNHQQQPSNNQASVNIQNTQQQMNQIQMEEFMGTSVRRQKIINNVNREFMGSGITRQRITKGKMSSSSKSMNPPSGNYQNQLTKVPRLHPPNPKSFSYQSARANNMPQNVNNINSNAAKNGQFMGQMNGNQGQGQYTGNVNQNMRQSQWQKQPKSKRVPSIISNFPQRNQRSNPGNMHSGNRMYQTGSYNPNPMVTIQNNQRQGPSKPVMSEFTQNEVIVQRLKPAKPTMASKNSINPVNPTQYNKYNLITNSPRKLSGFSRRA